jgi:hypothetical protein
MNWEQRFCPNQSCPVDSWMVERAADGQELWRLIEHVGCAAFLVAATDPACPRCGTTLCLTAELAHQAGDNALKARPLLEFARNSPRR